jgi:hypothetical protein
VNVATGQPLEGWELGFLTRVRSGSPIRILSGRNTFNYNSQLTNNGDAQALIAFNLTNLLLFTPGNGITTSLTINNTFGQTTGAYRGLQNTNDPVTFSVRSIMQCWRGRKLLHASASPIHRLRLARDLPSFETGGSSND